MAISSSSALQKLGLPNTSSPDFHDQVSRILDGEKYAQCKKAPEPGDLQWLVGYLDEVRRRAAYQTLDLS